MRQLLVFSLILVFFSSCGKNLTVNFADTALLWRVDDYFDINRDQRKDLKAQFRQALKTANDDYIPQFEKVIFAESLLTQDCAQVQKSYNQLKPHFEQLRNHIFKQSYAFIDSVDSKQIKHFIEFTNDEIAKDEKKSDSEKMSAAEKRLKRTQDTLRELFGDLTAEQQQSVQAHVLGQKSIEPLMLQSRKKNLVELQNKSEPAAKEFFKNYLVRWRDFQTPELKSAMLEREIINEKFYLHFFCQASVKQKKYFQTTVADYLNLFRKVYLSKL